MSFRQFTKTNPIKAITLALIIFLAAACCEAFDVPADSFTSGGSITGASVLPVSHSMLSLVQTGAHEDNSNVGSHWQNLERAAAADDLLSRIMRKLLTAASGYVPFGSLIHFRRYVLLICTSACISIFCPDSIRVIHLKDGSK